jgi:hypothetical protein
MKTSSDLCFPAKPPQIIREVHPLLKVRTTQLDEYRSYAILQTWTYLEFLPISKVISSVQQTCSQSVAHHPQYCLAQSNCRDMCWAVKNDFLTAIQVKMPLSCKVQQIVIVLTSTWHALVISVSDARRLDLEKSIIFQTSLSLSSLSLSRLVWLLKFPSSLICLTILWTVLTRTPTLSTISTPFIPPWHIPTMRARVSFGIVLIY